ncbi:glutathione S-transferase [Pseudidiomarina planktonica]|uniref:glutathione transferase n=1 Tax=Pseudidiomarina planktonica TaxID=1323738 RepID=A0A1Y6E7S1_9GAMM|nr:glutathione S-transferase family protein [Pseudidiomarina planktonica]RUO66346.1 glutathione S-transferase family protein [Pseudidiomarina planktonica]SMQ58676.1 glutathione S-transferase [Pseudidiomarina planktonica]
MKQQSLHLVTHILCPYVQRSIITLEEKSIAYTRVDIDLANKPDWFKQKSPMGRVPILLVDENRTLFESAVICEYLDEVTAGSLHPSDSLEKAYHRAWIEFGSGILQSISGLYNAKDSASFDKIHEEIQRKFGMLEEIVSGGPFFTGEQFHLLDAVYAPIFRYFDVFESYTNLNTFADLPKCQIWRSALRQRRSVQLAVAENYPDLLVQFLKSRDSYMSQLLVTEINND